MTDQTQPALSPTLAAVRDAILADPGAMTAAEGLASAGTLLAAHARELAAMLDRYADDLDTAATDGESSAIVPPAMADALLTPMQVQDTYGFNKQTLANWRWLGHGPAFIKTTGGKGGRIMYRRSDIEKFLDAQTMQPGSSAS